MSTPSNTMTKYVLNSGGVSKNTDKAKKFFQEVVTGLGNTPKILLCFFAIAREDWEAKYAQDLQEIPELLGAEVDASFELALPETFVTQLKNCDAVYLHGGDDHLLQYWLKQFDLPKLWEGKVVTTNSASSNALSKYFWTCDWRACMDGLGILPIKFLPHFKSSYGSTDLRGSIDWDKAYEELKNYKDTSLPIYALEEGDYQVFSL